MATRRALRRLTADVEQGLRDIDFPEVTAEDRVAFVQAAVAWQVKQALACRRFDLAVRLRRFGAERIARLDPRPAESDSRAGGF
jgi:hypothetical protein